MFKNISLGVYYPGNSLLHRLQARTKLLVLLWLIIFLTIANQRRWHFAPYVAVVALVLVGARLSHVSLGHMWRRMRLLVLFAILGGLTTLLLTAGEGAPLYALGPVFTSYRLLRWGALAYSIAVGAYVMLLGIHPAWRQPRRYRWLRRIAFLLIPLSLIVAASLWISRRIPNASSFTIGPLLISETGTWLLISVFSVFLSLYALSLLLTMTTTPVALVDGLTLLLAPLRRLGLPVDEFALMTLLALRFIPTLTEEAEQLIKAQVARGADFSNGSLRELLQSLTMLLVPLVRGALRRAAELATALEARGYEVHGQRTLLYETAFSPADYAVMSAIVAVTIGALTL